MAVDSSPKNLGIKMSQPFRDVTTAEDKDLIFSSSFPLLKEEATGVFNINGLSHTGQYIPVCEHKLGYYTFWTVMDDQSKMRLGVEWQMDENILYFLDTAPVFPPANGTGNFRWTVYRLPVFTAFDSGVTDTQTTDVGSYNGNFGFKAAKKGGDINSKDLRDFTIHSRGRSPMVHSVNVKEWERSNAQASQLVDPQLGYNPIAFGLVLNTSTNKIYNMQNGGQAAPRLTRRNGVIEIDSTGNATIKSSIIVFKDPFLSPVTRDIIY